MQGHQILSNIFLSRLSNHVFSKIFWCKDIWCTIYTIKYVWWPRVGRPSKKIKLFEAFQKLIFWNLDIVRKKTKKELGLYPYYKRNGSRSKVRKFEYFSAKFVIHLSGTWKVWHRKFDCVGAPLWYFRLIRRWAIMYNLSYLVELHKRYGWKSG